MLQALGCELETEVLHALYEGLEESLDAAMDGLVTAEFMEQCFPKIEDQVSSLMGSRQERAEERRGADLDEEDLEQMNEVEEAEAELLQQVVASIGGFLKCLGDAALPRVEALVQKFFNPLLAQASRGHEDRWVALLVISDCLEYAPSSSKHLPALLPELVKHAQSDSHDVANVCIYTLGVIAEKYPAVCCPSCGCCALCVCVTTVHGVATANRRPKAATHSAADRRTLPITAALPVMRVMIGKPILNRNALRATLRVVVIMHGHPRDGASGCRYTHSTMRSCCR